MVLRSGGRLLSLPFPGQEGEEVEEDADSEHRDARLLAQHRRRRQHAAPDQRARAAAAPHAPEHTDKPRQSYSWSLSDFLTRTQWYQYKRSFYLFCSWGIGPPPSPPTFIAVM